MIIHKNDDEDAENTEETADEEIVDEDYLDANSSIGVPGEDENSDPLIVDEPAKIQLKCKDCDLIFGKRIENIFTNPI